MTSPTCRLSTAAFSATSTPGPASCAPHRRCRPVVLRAFNTHNKCTGVCRFVRGVPVGTGCRVAELWGFCGASPKPLTDPPDQTQGIRVLQLLRTCDQSPIDPA